MLRLLGFRNGLSAGNKAGLKRFSNCTDIPASADVVVIGGGIAGCSTAYQLAKRGVNAVLLERSKLTSGTTWHTGGLVWSLRPNDMEVQLLANSQEVYKNVEIETGMHSGWINNGGLFISHSQIRTNEYMRLATLGKAFGIPSEMLSPEETCKLFPLMDPKSFAAALYSPNDGTIDPTMVCAALTKYAKVNGVKVLENCPAQGIEVGPNVMGNNEVKGVKTPNGVIKTKCIINCAGAWSDKVAGLANLPTLPLVAMKHAYIIFESVERVRGCPNIRDHDSAVYIKIQGDNLHMGGYEPNPIIIDKLPENFEFQLYELDWSVFGVHAHSARNLLPVLSNTGIRSTVYGPESFTPDHKPLMGEDPRLYGLYHNCAYNSAGMMFSGGGGIEIAEWVTKGRPNLSMFAFDIRRFSPEQLANKDWLLHRSHEAYAKNYAAVFPHDQPLAGRGVIKDVLHDDMLNDGAFMETRQGWERPAYFLPEQKLHIQPYDFYGAYNNPRNTNRIYEDMLKSDYTYGFSKVHDVIGREALACRNGAALFNISYYGKFYLTGPDAQNAADLIFTSDMNGDIGQVAYASCLNSKGGLECDLAITPIDGTIGTLNQPIFQGRGFYIVCSGFNSEHTATHIRSIINQYKLKANLDEVTKDVCILSIDGPNSRKILQDYTDADFSDEAFPAFSQKFINLYSNFPNKTEKATIPCRASRITWSGELGWELHVLTHHAQQLYKDLKMAKDLTVGGWRALTSLSIEKGNVLWNQDITIRDNPIECNLDFICKSDGYYIGKEHVEQARNKGVTKKYAFFTLEANQNLLGLETIYRNGKVAGYLRRGDYGFHLKKPIGTGYIRNTECSNDNVTDNYLLSGDYEIEVMGVKHKATIHKQSPFDPESKRVFGIYE